MIEAEDPVYPKHARRLKYLLAVLGILGLGYVIYKAHYFATAEYRYTIGEVTGRHNTENYDGIWFTYTVDGNKIKDTCDDHDCHLLENGTRCIVKYYVERPTWNTFYPQLKVPANLQPPPDGWEEIPEFEP